MSFSAHGAFYGMEHWTPPWIFLNTLGNSCLSLALMFFASRIFVFLMSARKANFSVFLSNNWLRNAAIILALMGVNNAIYIVAVVTPLVPLMALTKAVSGLYGLILCFFYNTSPAGSAPGVNCFSESKSEVCLRDHQ